MLAGSRANYYRSQLAGVNLETGQKKESITSGTGRYIKTNEYYRALTDDEIKEYTRYQVELEENEA